MGDETIMIGIEGVILAPGGTGGITGDEIGVITGDEIGFITGTEVGI